jgi:branched-chain amino acid transport system ATP-binding protein
MLKLENVSILFGTLKANNNVSMSIEAGKITCLIGPNGAGKTTLFNAISGVYKPNTGTITFLDNRIDGLKPYQINKMGISRTYQIINLFKNMPVIENVLVGMHSTLHSNYLSSILRTKSQRKEEEEILQNAYDLLQFVGIRELADSPAGSLPYGKQRLLEIVRGLASSPKLILLDEPAAGMNSHEKEELNRLIRQIIARGVSVLIVEHDMKLIMNIADKIFVLNSGELISEGTAEYVQKDPAVVTAYLGGDD